MVTAPITIIKFLCLWGHYQNSVNGGKSVKNGGIFLICVAVFGFLTYHLGVVILIYRPENGR